MLRIVISGGGTGGHIYPAIGIAKELTLLDPEAEIVFIGGKDRLESTIVPQHGFRFFPISVAGFPRALTWRWAPVIGKTCVGLVKSLFLLKKLKPKVVVGTGGYVSGPPLFAAVLLGIPIVVQDQSVSPGITNRLLSRWAKAAYLAFDTAAVYFPSAVAKVTGNPIRRAVGAVKRVPGIYEKFGLNPHLKTVFVMGGSQGAHAINEVMTDALDELESFHQQLQIIHQTGSADYKAVNARYSRSSLQHMVQAYFDSIEEVYSIADLMVCRAGGMTVSEITACGIPAIFIPLRAMAGNNQGENARAVAEAGGGVVRDESELTGDKLAGEIIALITEPERRLRMADASLKLGKRNAGESIAKSICSLISRGEEER